MNIEKHYRNNYDSLVKRYRNFLRDDVEDIIQETYTRAIKYYESYNPDRDFDHWFSRIMSNVIKSFKADRDGIVVDVDPNHLETANTPSVRLSERLIVGLTKGMREDHQEVVRLHYLYGYRPIDINQVSELTLTNINSILHNFRKRFNNG